MHRAWHVQEIRVASVQMLAPALVSDFWGFHASAIF
jgi:hypothetical protein